MPQIISTNRSVKRNMLAQCEAPGTCGELVQGAIDGQDFLVNCPVDLFSRATVYAGAAAGLHLRDAHSFSKIADAVALVSHGCRLTLRHEMAVESRIPRGKGMASSTADLTAAVEALCRSCAVHLSDRAFARLLTQVEPSDCVHFPGIAHVNHLTGELIETLPPPEDLRVLVVDCGGQIDTVAFDRERARSVYRRDQAEIAGALAQLKRGLREGDAHAVAQAATRSARLSQQILYKPQFERLLAVTGQAGALGVNCAHSGTVLGVLHRGSDRLADKLASVVRRTLGSSVEIHGDYQIIGGGCRAYQ